MLSIFFFPARLDPVLDGGPGHEDAVVAPEVPTGPLVGQAILGDQADGQILNATGVQALGQGQVRQIDREVEVAVATVMPGEGNNEIDWVARAWVTQIVQGARGSGVATGPGAAARAAAGAVVAAAAFDTRLGK